MKILRPLQISFNHMVLEQGGRFYFTASAILGINLVTGEELLDLYFLQDALEGMGESPLPDTGMPKPNGEFLVSGRFYTPEEKPATGGEVKVRLKDKEKNLFVFGPRKWQAGLPSAPEPITSMPLVYTKAFGGAGYEKNPDGIGFDDGLLPCIENPGQLITSKNDKPGPAGFAPLTPMLPQRMQYQGTYDVDYKRKYFPGYPQDHDWKYFLCAPEDQWIKGYYQGNEIFALYNMHPEIPVIEGRLPGLYARCFINQKQEGGSVFGELPLNLDTIWFFPDKLLGLLIFRGVTEVRDDEAEDITHVLCALEDGFQERRDLEYYRAAFNKRQNSDDELLTNLKTRDLIPEGHKSAMELLFEGALSNTDENEFSKNVEAKSAAMQKMADQKIEEAIEQAEKNMQDIDIPDQARELLSGQDGKPDIRKLISSQRQAQPDPADPDLRQLNTRLEAAIPGITAGDPAKLDLKDFSFDKIDEIMLAVDEFSEKKKKTAKDLAKKELDKARNELEEQVEEIDRQIDKAALTGQLHDSEEAATLKASKQKIQDSIQAIDEIDLDGIKKKKAPLPRINPDDIKAQTEQVNPQIMEALAHVQSMKAMGMEDERIRELENQVQEIMETSRVQIEQGLDQAEKNFKEAYAMAAHFMDEGTSPHQEDVAAVRERFLQAFSQKKSLADKDWACIDLSGEILDGIDLTGAFLEQVNFQGASLKGARLKGAILARANLEDADLTGADLEEANIGAVHAHGTNFAGANLKSAKLAKGDFTGADFSGADLEDIQTLEIIINETCFAKAYLPQVFFLETAVCRANFQHADINTCAFIKCTIENTDFKEADMKRCGFVDTDLRFVSFDGADLSNACFTETETDKMIMEEITFRSACLKQANFQNMKLQKAVLSDANLENAFFGSTDLCGADLSRAYAKSAQFRKASLDGAKLDDINLAEGSLAKARLTGASFKRANLYQTDFLRATITDTDFSDSNLDATLIEHWRPR